MVLESNWYCKTRNGGTPCQTELATRRAFGCPWELCGAVTGALCRESDLGFGPDLTTIKSLDVGHVTVYLHLKSSRLWNEGAGGDSMITRAKRVHGRGSGQHWGMLHALSCHQCFLRGLTMTWMSFVPLKIHILGANVDKMWQEWEMLGHLRDGTRKRLVGHWGVVLIRHSVIYPRTLMNYCKNDVYESLDLTQNLSLTSCFVRWSLARTRILTSPEWREEWGQQISDLQPTKLWDK